MRLIYSPFFGARPYTDLASRGGMLFDAKAVGTVALLGELELRCGLTGSYPSGAERLVAYAKAMRAALAETPGLFFGPSFQGDELGTAKVILGWRDSLVRALWDFDPKGSERLGGIAAAERHFSSPGDPDRWKALAGVLASGDVRLSGLELECTVSGAALDPCVRRALELLPGCGAAVSFEPVREASAPQGTALRTVQDILLGKMAGEGEKVTLPEDGTFRHLRYDYAYDAYQAAAFGTDPADGRLLVAADPGRLNDSLTALGRPRVGSESSGYPQTLQLFLLGLSLFRSPLDVNSLTSYLRVPVNPLGRICVPEEKTDGTAWYRPLNHALLDSLLSDGGIMKWDGLIEKALYDREGNTVQEKVRREVLDRLFMWKGIGASGDIPVENLRDYCANMRRWAEGAARSTGDVGLPALAACFRSVEELTEGMTGSVAPVTLRKWAAALLQPVVTDATPAEEGSPATVRDVRDTLDAPHALVWLGCVGDAGSSYPYDFLSEDERALVGVPSREDASRYAHGATAAALARVTDSLTLVTWDLQDGTPAGEHPVMVELKAKASFDPVPREEMPGGFQTSIEAAPAGERKSEYHVGPEVFAALDKMRSAGGLRRNVESSSSLEKLIQSPFDYVTDYLLGLQPYGEADLQDVQTVRGNVAHLYVNRLAQRGGGDPARMEALHGERFDEMLRECTEEKGAVLLLEENLLDFERYRRTLGSSVTRLLALMRRHGLTVAGSETELEVDLPVIGPFKGYVDLLLKDASGRFVIVDMKWSEGKTYYTKTEQGNVLQLAMYNEAVRASYGQEAVAAGYWVFPKKELVAVEGTFLDGDEAVKTFPSTGRDVFKEVCRSYQFRMRQLRVGLIEEGEGLALADLDYYRQQDALGLYPLNPMYGAEALKGGLYGDPNQILKGGLK